MQRHADERPDKLPLQIEGRAATQLVSPADHPNYLILPKLPEPGILSGSPLGLGYFVTLKRFGDSQVLRGIARRHGGAIRVMHEVNITAFLKMLAKIAHGLVAAELDETNEFNEDIFRPYLPDFIRGIDPNLGTYLIGQSKRIIDPPIDAVLHKLFIATLLERNRHLIAVGVKLFSNWRGFTYCVIAGELVAPPRNFLVHWLKRKVQAVG